MTWEYIRSAHPNGRRWLTPIARHQGFQPRDGIREQFTTMNSLANTSFFKRTLFTNALAAGNVKASGRMPAGHLEQMGMMNTRW